MSRPLGAALLTLLSWGIPGPALAEAAPPWVHASADGALVERVLRETRVEREVPRPSYADYAGYLLERIARRLAEGIGRALELARALGIQPRVVAWIVVGLLMLAVGLMLAGIVRRPRRRPAAPRVSAAPRREPPALPPGRDVWRRELERRLAAGDAAGALEALWWWFARSLAGARVDASWTSRELLAQAGRPDLSPLAHALDRMLYGVARPAAEDVRGLAGRVDEALA